MKIPYSPLSPLKIREPYSVAAIYLAEISAWLYVAAWLAAAAAVVVVVVVPDIDDSFVVCWCLFAAFYFNDYFHFNFLFLENGNGNGNEKLRF